MPFPENSLMLFYAYRPYAGAFVFKISVSPDQALLLFLRSTVASTAAIATTAAKYIVSPVGVFGVEGSEGSSVPGSTGVSGSSSATAATLKSSN